MKETWQLDTRWYFRRLLGQQENEVKPEHVDKLWVLTGVDRSDTGALF